MSEWHPIETAPKDGQRIIVGGRDALGEWTMAYAIYDTPPEWSSRIPGWQVAHWVAWPEDGYIDFIPTHWTVIEPPK